MVDPEKLNKAFGHIPEVYYDLICRFCPGLMLVMASYFLISDSGINKIIVDFKDVSLVPGTLLLLMVFVSSYILAILLSPLSTWIYKVSMLSWCWSGCYEEHESLISRINKKYSLDLSFPGDETMPVNTEQYQKKQDPKKQRKKAFESFLRLTHDLLKDENEQARLILPKMQAEVNLCRILASGLIVLLVVLAVIHFSINEIGDIYIKLIVITILACFAVGTGIHRGKGLWNRQFSYLRRLEPADSKAAAGD